MPATKNPSHPSAFEVAPVTSTHVIPNDRVSSVRVPKIVELEERAAGDLAEHFAAPQGEGSAEVEDNHHHRALRAYAKALRAKARAAATQDPSSSR